MKNRFSLQQFRSLISRMPFNASLGIRVTRLHRDGVTIECPFRDDFRNGAGVLHGGVTATMADVAAGMAITNHFGARHPATTIEMKVNFFRPVTGGKIVARSHLLRAGNTVCVSRVDLFDEDRRLVGAALVTYMLLK